MFVLKHLCAQRRVNMRILKNHTQSEKVRTTINRRRNNHLPATKFDGVYPCFIIRCLDDVSNLLTICSCDVLTTNRRNINNGSQQ